MLFLSHGGPRSSCGSSGGRRPHARAAACLCAAALALGLSACSGEPPAAEAAAGVDTPAAQASGHDGHAATPHGDHTPHYGGIVMMKGDLHFEVVLGREGTHHVYFSDELRAELPASVASEVTLTVSGPSMAAESLPATIDDSGESWIARGAPLSGPDILARVAFVVNEEPYWIDLPYAPTSTP